MATQHDGPGGNPGATDSATNADTSIRAPFQLFDPLPDHIEAALRASIQRFGVLVPVTVDQHGYMIDGHHRARIAGELKVPFTRLVRTVADDDEAREIALTLNADRRHLSEEQRREVAQALREQGHSIRAIAGALGVGKSTVDRDLSTVPGGTVPERVVGLDGKSRPARRAQIIVHNTPQQDRAIAAMASARFGDVAPGGTIDLRRAERIRREAAATQRRADFENHRYDTTAGSWYSQEVITPGPLRRLAGVVERMGHALVDAPPHIQIPDGLGELGDEVASIEARYATEVDEALAAIEVAACQAQGDLYALADRLYQEAKDEPPTVRQVRVWRHSTVDGAA